MTTVPPKPPPAPSALRLLGGRAGARIKPPYGLARWSDDSSADAALVLERPGLGESPTLAEVTEQVPHASTLPPGTLVVMLAELSPHRSLLQRWFGTKGHAPRYVRSSALLARGYERIGGGREPKSRHDLVWGYAAAR